MVPKTGSISKIDEKLFDRIPVIGDLVITRRFLARQFEPVERRFASHGGAVFPLGFELAGKHGEDRIVAQGVVVDEVFVAEREPEDPLPDKRRNGMFYEFRLAMVGETSGEPRARCDQLTVGLPPTRVRSCWAHNKKKAKLSPDPLFST
jgi:hypothetical protein